MDIAGKVFVVTGAGSGIGRAVALRMLAGGASVAGVDLNEEALEATAELAQAGDRFTAHAVNITDRAAVEALPEAVLAAHGTVDGLANIAGVIQKFERVIDLDYSEIEKVMNVNFWGVINTVKAFLPLLTERPEASLLNVASMGAYAPVPGQAVYGASKAAVSLLTEALYAELLGTNVTVTAIYPGAIDTNIVQNSGARMQTTPDAGTESKRKMTSPAEAARVIVEAIEKGRFRATIGSDAAMMDRLSRLNPKLATELIGKQMADLLN